MSDPKERQQEPDELDLDTEMVKDLEVEPTDGDSVRGGYTGACATQSHHCSKPD